MRTKRELEEARRVRAGVIGLLECCRCMYPLEHYETESHHAENCPSHAMTLSARRVESRAAFLQIGVDADLADAEKLLDDVPF